MVLCDFLLLLLFVLYTSRTLVSHMDDKGLNASVIPFAVGSRAARTLTSAHMGYIAASGLTYCAIMLIPTKCYKLLI